MDGKLCSLANISGKLSIVIKSEFFSSLCWIQLKTWCCGCGDDAWCGQNLIYPMHKADFHPETHPQKISFNECGVAIMSKNSAGYYLAEWPVCALGQVDAWT